MNYRIMVITHVIPYYYERGSSLRLHMLIKGLIGLGNEVHLVTTHLGEDIELKGLIIHRTPRLFFLKRIKHGFSFEQIYLNLLLFFEALSLFNKLGPDIIIGESLGINWGIILKKMYKKPLIYNMDNSLSQYYEVYHRPVLKRIGALFDRFWYKHSDYIIANWECSKQIVLRLHKTNNITVINDRVEKIISPTKSVSLPPNYAIYVGNFVKYQGVEILINAFHKVRKFISDLNLVLVGPNPHKSIRQLAVENNSIFFTGKLSLSETNGLIKDAMFAVLPRIAPGLPGTKLIQYIQFGKAILAVDIPDNTLFLKNLESVLTCKAEIDDMAEKMIFLAKNGEFRLKLEQNAEKVGERFSFKNLEKNLKFVIEQVCNKKS